MCCRNFEPQKLKFDLSKNLSCLHLWEKFHIHQPMSRRWETTPPHTNICDICSSLTGLLQGSRKWGVLEKIGMKWNSLKSKLGTRLAPCVPIASYIHIYHWKQQQQLLAFWDYWVHWGTNNNVTLPWMYSSYVERTSWEFTRNVDNVTLLCHPPCLSFQRLKSFHLTGKRGVVRMTSHILYSFQCGIASTRLTWRSLISL